MSNFAQLEKEIAYVAKGNSLSWGHECARLIDGSTLLCKTDSGDEACGLFFNRLVGSFFVAAKKNSDQFLRTYQGMMQTHPGTGNPSLAMMVRTPEGHFVPRGLAFLMEDDGLFSVRIKYRDEILMSCEPRAVRWFAPLMCNPGIQTDVVRGQVRVSQQIPALFRAPMQPNYHTANSQAAAFPRQRGA